MSSPLHSLLSSTFSLDDPTNIELPTSCKYSTFSSKRFSQRVGSCAFLPQLSPQFSQSSSPTGFKLELSGIGNHDQSRLNSLRTDRQKNSVITTQDESQRHEHLKQSHTTDTADHPYKHTTSSLIDTNCLKTPAASLKQQALRRENIRLRAQNKQLKDQIQNLRRTIDHSDKRLQKINYSNIELQRNIRTLTKKVRDADRNLEYLKQEQKLNRQIREKLEKRINVLLQDNAQLDYSLQNTLQKVKNLQIVEKQFERVRQQFIKLQKYVQDDDRQWEMHKEMWQHEKQYYREIIRKLEFQLQHSGRL